MSGILAARPHEFWQGQEAKELFAQGYRQVSRRFGIVSRVTMSDEKLKAFFLRDVQTKNLALLSAESQRDQYRSCFSTDQIERVPDDVMRELRELVKGEQVCH